MVDVAETPRRRVLCVGEAADRFSHELSEALAPLEAELVYVPDVYIAVARLLRTPRTRFHAVVVNLDYLLPEEMDFISHVRHLLRNLPVFVYADSDSAIQSREAEARGARRVDAVDPIRAAVEVSAAEPARAPSSATAASRAAAAESAPRADERDVEPPQGTAVHEEDVHPPGDAREAGDAAPPSRSGENREETRVPTPWSPSPHRPLRQPPQTQGEEPENAEDEASQDEDGRPILSDAELDALLGSDLTPPDEGAEAHSTESERDA